MTLADSFTPVATRFGTWMTEAQVQLIAPRPRHGKRIRLLSPLVWADTDGELVIVPRGFESDGGSIPRLLWSFVGAPLDDAYVVATILHDWECEQRAHSSAQVHERFYRSMRAAGTSWLIARGFYHAVRIHGPSWTINQGLSDGH